MFIKSFTTGKEGVAIELSEKTNMIGRNIKGTSFWVAWDKIWGALFNGYIPENACEERKKYAGEDNNTGADNNTAFAEEDVDTPLDTCRWEERDTVILTDCYNKLRVDLMNPVFEFCPFCRKVIRR